MLSGWILKFMFVFLRRFHLQKEDFSEKEIREENRKLFIDESEKKVEEDVIRLGT